MKRLIKMGAITTIDENHHRFSWTDSEGIRHFKRVTGTLEDAQKAQAAIILDGGNVSGNAPSITWAAYWDAAVVPSFDGLAARTVAEYKRLWKKELSPRIGSDEVSALTWRRAESVLNDICSPGVARSCYRLWRKVANMAVRDGLLGRNPIDRTLNLPKVEKANKTLLDAADLADWLKCIRGSKAEAVLLMECGGGLRHEESCAMVWENIAALSFGGRTYAAVKVERALVDVPSEGKHLKAPKTPKSNRVVIIGEPFASRLLELKQDRGAVSPPTYRRPIGETYAARDFASPLCVTHNYRYWVERRSGKYVAPGHLRSNYATWMGEAGAPDSLVSLAMGHTDGTTKGAHYQQATVRGFAMIADMLTDYLETPKGWTATSNLLACFGVTQSDTETAKVTQNTAKECSFSCQVAS